MRDLLKLSALYVLYHGNLLCFNSTYYSIHTYYKVPKKLWICEGLQELFGGPIFSGLT